MSLNGEQFKFRINPDPQETSVVAYAPGTSTSLDSPVASVAIIHGNYHQNRMQQQINRSAEVGASYPTHGEAEVGRERLSETRSANESQIPGQRHWTGGNFQPSDPDYIGWLHAGRGGAAALKPMLGMAVQEAGRVPVADSELTADGSRISRSMSRKVGIPGHPKNPEMRPTLTGSDALSAARSQGITTGLGEDSWGSGNAREASAEDVRRGVQTSNAMVAHGPAAEARQARREKLQAGQFEQLSFDL